MQHDERAEITLHLNTVAGHLHAICSSVEAGKSREEVLRKIVVIASLKKIQEYKNDD